MSTSTWLPPDCFHALTRVRAADQALYFARSTGRNRIEVMPQGREGRSRSVTAVRRRCLSIKQHILHTHLPIGKTCCSDRLDTLGSCDNSTAPAIYDAVSHYHLAAHYGHHRFASLDIEHSDIRVRAHRGGLYDELLHGQRPISDERQTGSKRFSALQCYAGNPKALNGSAENR